MRTIRPSLAVRSFAVLAFLSVASAALQLSPATRATPLQRGKSTGESQERGEPAGPARRPVPVAGLRGELSDREENEAGENDPDFDYAAGLRGGRRAPSGSTASGATSATLRLADHPKRDDLARWLEDSLRGREIDVALLGGHKYMINSCLGLKASAGQFRLKLENPRVYFEDTGIVLRLEIDRVSLSAFKIRIRPNPNPIELCKFSKKFEVGGVMEDVRLTLRFDPLYDLERCRIGKWNDYNPEIRIGNLNLKPLQNDLDRMAKNMVEDSLTFALQMAIDGVVSPLGDLTLSALDQFLEADCPTRAGETARAVDRLGGAIRSGADGAARAGDPLAGGGTASPGAGSAAGAAAGPGPSSAPGSAAEVDRLLARIAELEQRVAELEAGGAPPRDLRALLAQATERLAALDPAELAGIDLRRTLAELIAVAIERAALGEPRAVMDEIARRVLEPDAAEPVGAAAPPAATGPWYLAPNPELKGRMGRLVVRFPASDLDGSTLVVLQRNGQKVSDHYGDAAWELLPGIHDVQVTRVPIPGLEVRPGHDTVVRTGVLAIELGDGTLVKVFQRGGQEQLCDRYGSLTVGLPIGDYEVEIQGQRAAVSVREGEVTRF